MNENNSSWPKHSRPLLSYALGFFLMLFCSSFVRANEIKPDLVSQPIQQQITGTVTDQNGEVLPGANVIVKGTTNGTQTDFDGNYSIEASGNVTLIFSYVGFPPWKSL